MPSSTLDTAGRYSRVPRAPRRVGAAMSAAAMAVPERVVTNEEVGARLGVDDAWIVRRTGVRERRVAAEGQTVVDLGAEAALRSLALAGCRPDDVDMLLVATMSADDLTPSAAPLVAARAGLRRAAAIDVGAACTGWLAGVRLAAAEIESGRSRRVLVVGADMLSRLTDPEDRNTAPLFADGAGAVLVSDTHEGSRIAPVVMGVVPEGAAWIYARRHEGVIRMVGYETFRLAVNHMVEATHEAVAAAGLALEDVDLFAYHQANARILAAVAERLGIDEDKLVMCVDRYGNTAAATVPIALATAAEDGRLAPGRTALLAACGAGFSWGATVVTWG